MGTKVVALLSWFSSALAFNGAGSEFNTAQYNPASLLIQAPIFKAESLTPVNCFGYNA
jgi:hypothetical protein